MGAITARKKDGLEDQLRDLPAPGGLAIEDMPRPTEFSDRARCERLNAAMQNALIEWRDMENQQQALLNRFHQLNNERLVTDLLITTDVNRFREGLLNAVRFIGNIRNGIGAILSRRSAATVRALFSGTGGGAGSGGSFAAAIDALDVSLAAMDLPGLIQRHRELTELMNSEEMRAMMSLANALERGWQQKRDLYRSIARDYEDFGCERFGIQSIGRAP